MARLAISIAGAAIGNAILPGIGGQIGFALGSAAANYLLQPSPPTQFGPKIEDARVSSSAYGGMLPIVYGTIDVAGNIIDAGPLDTVEHRQEVGGGKGAPEQEVVTYTQFMDFDVALCESAEGVVRIYANERIIYDATPGATVKQPSWLNFTLYPGSETQTADPTFEAIRGAGEVPGYRGTAHVVFRRFNITEFGTAAITFRFVVTTNGTASSSVTTYDQGGTGYTRSIIHSEATDLMIGSIDHAIDGSGSAPMLVAIDPYSRTQVWRTEITDADQYSEGNWTLQCSFFVLNEFGALKYQPNAFIAVVHERNASFPTERFLRFFHADSGIQYGFVEISTSDSFPNTVSCFSDDAVFYQRRFLGAPATVSMRRHTVSELLNVATASIVAPAGYDWFGDNEYGLSVKTGSRIAGTNPVLVGSLENSSTGAFGFVTWEDGDVGAGGTSFVPAFSAVTEIASGHGGPVAGVYDPGEDCFWIMSTSTVTVIHRVELDGTLTSSTDWNATFSIAGVAQSMTIDTARDRLWTVISGVAYGWPTYDTTQTPIARGSAIKPTALSWHPYSGTLFAGEVSVPADDIYYQFDVDNLTGGGETLQTVVEAICDAPGTNLTTADRTAVALSAITVSGFRIATFAQRRAALDAMRSIYLFDLVPRDGVLTAVARGASSSATLDDEHLGAHVKGSRRPPLITISRDSEAQLPRTVGVRFIDSSQNYEAGFEASTRLASSGGTEMTIDAAAVLSHDEAAQLSSVLLHATHIETEKYTTTVMPSQRDAVVPAAVVTLTANGNSHVARVVNANIVDGGVIACEAVRSESSVYSDFSVGGTPRNRLRSVSQVGQTQVIALDLPALQQADLNAGYYVAVTSYSPEWPGAVVYESGDGANYAQQAVINSESTAGFVTAALADGQETDTANTLSVRLVEGSLASVSDIVYQTDATANYAAIGSDGRWEIIKFRDVAEAAGVYTLSVITRGLRDTQAAKASHVAGDRFVLLTRATLARMLLDDAFLNTQRWTKAVTIGKPIDEAVPVSLTPAGRALLPYRVAALDAQRSGSDWSLSWNRQDRRQARFLQTPVLSEAPQAYLVEILDYSGNVLRSATVGTEAYTYTSADQTTDFGGAIDLLRWRVQQVSATVGNGPVSESFTGTYPVSYDAFVTARAALVDFWPLDETSGTTAVSNSATHDGTYSGNLTLNSTSLTNDGAPSVQFNPSINTGRVDVTPGSWSAAIRAVDFVIRPNAFSGISQDQGIIWLASALGSGAGWAVTFTQAGNVKFYADPSDVFSGADTAITGSTALTLGEIYHIQVSWGATSGDPIEIYVNGQLDGSGTLATSVTFPSTGFFRFANSYGQHLRSNLAKIGTYNAALTAYDAAIATTVAKGITT